MNVDLAYKKIKNFTNEMEFKKHQKLISLQLSVNGRM
jgi:hypothetical protein